MIIKPCKKIVIAVFVFVIFISSGRWVYDSYAIDAENIQSQKNVLILHSYSEGLPWTSEQNSGIIETLGKANSNNSIFVEYIDWKNYPYSYNLKYLYDYYKFKYRFKNLDLILTTDDAAFTFALENRKELFSNAPIVFSGVNKESLSKIDSKYKDFTGVIEVIDPTETIKMALNINPSIKNIYVVFDNSESGISTGKLVSEKIKALDMGLNTIELNGLYFNELLKVVSNLDNKSMVLFATYYSDVSGNILEFKLASREISRNSTVPIYHLYDFGLNQGAFGGNMLSGRLSGNRAGELAHRILNGEAADSIPVSSPNTTRKVFDYQQVKRFDIPLSKLPKDAEVINKPFSFIETYKLHVLGILLIFSIMLILLMSLLGLEALLRWKSPELGFVSPLRFIKVAEDTHLIIPLGEWVLIQACDFLSKLHKSGHENMIISVNISTIQILQADFTDKVLKIIDYFQVDPRCLELEVTESVLIESFDMVYKKLLLLSEKGIGIALDDFGKGYSSLSYLKQLPISTLKIDKCFIDYLSIGVENKTITRHIINMGRALGMSVVAEGVELEEQMEYLKKYQCDKIQGYLFSKPLPKEEIEKLLHKDISNQEYLFA